MKLVRRMDEVLTDISVLESSLEVVMDLAVQNKDWRTATAVYDGCIQDFNEKIHSKLQGKHMPFLLDCMYLFRALEVMRPEKLMNCKNVLNVVPQDTIEYIHNKKFTKSVLFAELPKGMKVSGSNGGIVVMLTKEKQMRDNIFEAVILHNSVRDDRYRPGTVINNFCSDAFEYDVTENPLEFA